ncbi:MAG: 50S ribosomal protein L24 [Vagococcus sp.]
MKIKKGDKVQVISGQYKGTTGEVTKVFPNEEKVIVEGVNLMKKHLKPTQDNPDGGIIEIEVPLHVSNVMAYDAKAKKASKIGYKIEDGVKTRVFKATGNDVDKKKKGAK